MTQNNTDASAVSEGEMTANALLEALGTTLEPDPNAQRMVKNLP